MKNLVIVYESMKPQVAAKFFDELPLEVLMGLVQSMNPKKTSAIFSSMNTEKVKSITDKIALMPRIPER
jgi:flagellar motility protein MotE (MotC chaperone)